MNDVPNPVTKDTGTLGTMTSQDVKRLLSIKMPGRESEFKDWQQYNEQQYTVLLIVSATEEERRKRCLTFSMPINLFLRKEPAKRNL